MPPSPSLEVTPEALEQYRRELTGYCYRMLGSGFEADDAVQETMLRAWRSAGRFEGRSSLRSWLYRIATNTCLDMLRGRQRRALPMDLGPASPPVESLLGQWHPEDIWISPIADARVLPEHGDPAEIAVARDTIRLAFITAIQHLPPRQRAALILCEVLRMPAAEAAATLGTSVAAVNSALQRARATLAALPEQQRPAELDAGQAGLLARYVEAFQRYDMEQLVTLLHDDAVMTMPPYATWFRGARDICRFMLEPTPSLCRGSVLVPAGQVNGVPAFGQYKPDPAGGYLPWALQVHEASGGRLARLTFFLDTKRIFPEFGLPARLG
ncbi:MAG TPA: sigma-70 family RNA polymerase sigma factor [Streptosporangiaceae bacterium]|jgi:RNA polymerase sigma-70 factor (ECF subfamily)|nr:sigma-70 family RNA polymerase sigma factor [Streptosporangiaceae bacterium]